MSEIENTDGLKTLLAYISGSADEELLLRNEHLIAENHLLCNQLQGCVQLTDAERKTLARLATSLASKHWHADRKRP